MHCPNKSRKTTLYFYKKICETKFRNQHVIHIILCNTAVHMYKETENINIYLKKIIIHIQCCFVFLVSSFLCVNMKLNKVKSKENRIYIRVEFTWKKCKSAILLLCFHTAGVLHTFVLNNLLGPGTSFYIKVFLLHSHYKRRFLHLNFFYIFTF